MIEILNFEKEYIEDVMNIWLKCNLEVHDFIKENYFKDNFELVKEEIQKSHIKVAKENNEVVGFIGVNHSYIEGIFVDKNHRNNGIGKMLLDKMKEDNNFLTLSVYKRNTRAIDFYKKNGFIMVNSNIDSLGYLEYDMVYKKSI